MVGRVPTYKLGVPDSIPGGVRNFNFCSGIECLYVSFVCVLSYVVSVAGPDVVLTTHSGKAALVFLSTVLVHSLFLHLKASDPGA